MSYALRKIPKELIVVFKAAADFAVADEIESAARDMLALLDSMEENVFLIADLSDQASVNMEDMMTTTNRAARGEASPMHHPNLRQIVFVTRNPAFKMAAEGLGHDIYGNMFVPVYENYEDAMAYARSKLA